MIEHVYQEQPIVITRHGRAFVITAQIGLDGTQIKWFVPSCLREGLEARATQLEPDSLDRPDTIASLSEWLNELLGMKEGAWFDLAVGYRYPEESIVLLPNEPAVFHKDCEAEPEGFEEANEAAAVERFRDLPYYAVVFDGPRIVSGCSHKGNGVISIGTVGGYQRRGYAASCLRVVTDRSIRAGITMGYGTLFDNAAARATAERCGYVLNNLSYWGCVSGPPYSKLPEALRANLEHRTQP